MVAVLLRLRFRVLANTLGRNTIQLIAVILGGVSSFGLLAASIGVMLFISSAPPAATQTAVVVFGSALVFGWLIVPLLFDGVDRTLDPIRLARFPLRTTQLMAAMFLVGVTWIPGIMSLLASLGTALAWIAHPASAVVAIATGLIGVTTCVVGSRLTTSVAGTLLRGRGASRFFVVLLILLVLAGSIAAAIAGGARTGRGTPLSTFTSIVDVLGWTPFGAIWSVPGRLAMGDAAGAGGAALVGIGSLVILVVLWRLTLGASFRVRGDGPARAATGGHLGPLGWLPTTPTGAVAARSLIYWFRDARLARQLILIPVLPALLLVWWRLFHIDGIAFAAGPLVASLLPLSVFAGLSYDGTAFAAELAAGVRGLHDRLGRAIALLAIAAPAAVLVQVAIALIIGRVVDLPAMLGLTLGTLLISVGVVSVSSARIVVPVPRSGRNPFSAQPGSATVSIVGSYAVTGVTIVLALPVIAVAVVALVTGAAVWGWVALAVGLVLGVALAWAGVVLGGRTLDVSGPAVLARLRTIRD